MVVVREVTQVQQVGRGYLDNHVSISETLDALSVVVQNSDSLAGLLRINVLNFAFGDILFQELIHELQGVRDLVLGPWDTLRDVFCAGNDCHSLVQ